MITIYVQVLRASEERTIPLCVLAALPKHGTRSKEKKKSAAVTPKVTKVTC